MKKLLVFVLVGVVVTGFSSLPATAGGAGVCVTARVDKPFHLPDGVLYPAGALTICDGGAYSPVDNFHRILVSGSTIGLFVSSRRVAELRSTGAPQILFNRESDGNLSLIGYVLPSLGESVAFRMKPTTVTQASVHPTGGGESVVPPPTTVATTSAR